MTQTQKPFKFYITDLKDSKPLTSEPSVFLQGFPYDEGALINGERSGSDRGPAIFRYELTNSPHYPTDTMEKIKLYDIGDVAQSFIEASIPLTKAFEILQQKTSDSLTDQQNCSFTIGGSQDLTLPLYNSLRSIQKDSKIGLICIDAKFDAAKSDKIHSGSYLRNVLDDPLFEKNQGKVVMFGSQGAQCSKS